MMFPLQGVTVTVSYASVFMGTDEFGQAIPNPRTSESYMVENVLLAPDSSADVEGSIRLAGDEDRLVAYFPKSFRRDLRGALVAVPSSRSKYRVEGNPTSYLGDLTPGLWDRVVRLVKVEG